jgi:penicillin-binding protein 1A
MVDNVGPRRVSQLANKAGINSELPAVCSIALGTLPVTPLEMSRAFVTFAARGRRAEAIAVTKIVGRGGRVIAERQPAFEQVMKENVADTVNHALQQVVIRGTGRSAALGRPAAGKTGTTENHVDAWFAGYTPDLVAVVWIGYPPKDGKIPEMTNVRGREVVGGSFPAVIWRKFMSAVLKDTKASSFSSPSLDGEVIVPSPTPCPPGATPPPGFFCASPSPEPSPEPLQSETPSPSPTPTPTKPSPSPSTPSPSPSG